MINDMILSYILVQHYKIICRYIQHDYIMHSKLVLNVTNPYNSTLAMRNQSLPFLLARSTVAQGYGP